MEFIIFFSFYSVFTKVLVTNSSADFSIPDSDFYLCLSLCRFHCNICALEELLYYKFLYHCIFYVAGIKCPVCAKFVLPDDIECHLVLCLTKPRLSYNGSISYMLSVTVAVYLG
jgi:hypothetical protein